ncbi:penicillin-binding transpeptidase domain-containing protein [Tissierella sp. Yu-01]|uniref:peptidoglycan D,D-transpeptidase FtsI family protein n=1 Tax=Tissierella sp. Yu-01 TaxID=3035694 RepID=UPI00240D7077|nr:penicillin-binding transpeptidase domain-containing protein [Tissierella sp. Yu-01]WFA09669.1 penicillin-binding transpeptidase domain-containing protein [Tissierella sp. Yu-01]
MFSKKRVIFFSIISFILFVCLGMRLYYIQVYKYPTYSEMALKQRSREISLNPRRGVIYDRYLVPLTNTDSSKIIIIPKDIIINDKELYNEVLENTTLSFGDYNKIINLPNNLLQIPVKNEFEVSNYSNSIFITEVVKRYRKDSLLSHVIGYINKSENTGEAGIERVYDEYLSKSDEKSFVIEYDKSRSIILNGTEYVNEISDPNNPTSVKLTIDSKIQSIVENIIDEERIKGAVVVADVDNGEILALASRPNFNQDEIEKYLSNDEMALYNKAIQVGYPPGSIFKIVVLLAALESEYNILDEDFYCPGYEDINNIRIKCTGVHGEVSLEEAFSLSCNSAFIQVGKKIGSEKIIELAQRLNFGEKINIGLLEEISGNLPDGDNLKGPAIGNISIGQGMIEATPLQITNLLMIIANNGVQKHMTIIDSITNKDGDVIKSYNKEPDKAVVLPSIAEIAYNYLITVVKEGTGKSMNLDSIGGAGGKTGSAEAVLYNDTTIHGWFAGFFPERSPKYVITVFIEEGFSGSKSAAPIFEKISKEINNIYPVY